MSRQYRDIPFRCPDCGPQVAERFREGLVTRYRCLCCQRQLAVDYGAVVIKAETARELRIGIRNNSVVLVPRGSHDA